jgi:RimJ/RimL family protein N-acetyltransferase
MQSVPQLQTARLRLRGHRAADHLPAVKIWQREEVYASITGVPLDSGEVWQRLLRYSGLWDFLGFGYWAVEDRLSGAYIGQMGFADFKRGVAGLEDGCPEAGWAMHPEWRGQGFASEGMAAACRWLDEETDWKRSSCIIGADNATSIRLAERLGYRLALTTEFRSEPTGLYHRERGAS